MASQRLDDLGSHSSQSEIDEREVITAKVDGLLKDRKQGLAHLKSAQIKLAEDRDELQDAREQFDEFLHSLQLAKVSALVSETGFSIDKFELLVTDNLKQLQRMVECGEEEEEDARQNLQELYREEEEWIKFLVEQASILRSVATSGADETELSALLEGESKGNDNTGIKNVEESASRLTNDKSAPKGPSATKEGEGQNDLVSASDRKCLGIFSLDVQPFDRSASGEKISQAPSAKFVNAIAETIENDDNTSNPSGPVTPTFTSRFNPEASPFIGISAIHIPQFFTVPDLEPPVNPTENPRKVDTTYAMVEHGSTSRVYSPKALQAYEDKMNACVAMVKGTVWEDVCPNYAFHNDTPCTAPDCTLSKQAPTGCKAICPKFCCPKVDKDGYQRDTLDCSRFKKQKELWSDRDRTHIQFYAHPGDENWELILAHANLQLLHVNSRWPVVGEQSGEAGGQIEDMVDIPNGNKTLVSQKTAEKFTHGCSSGIVQPAWRPIEGQVTSKSDIAITTGVSGSVWDPEDENNVPHPENDGVVAQGVKQIGSITKFLDALEFPLEGFGDFLNLPIQSETSALNETSLWQHANSTKHQFSASAAPRPVKERATLTYVEGGRRGPVVETHQSISCTVPTYN